MGKIKEYYLHFKFVPLFIISHFSHHVMTALLAPLLPFIRSEFALNYAQSGLLVSAFSLSYGLSQVPSGWLADKMGPRVLILVGISGVAAAGALVGISQTYLLLILSLVLMGITGGGYHPSASPLISSSVQPRYQGKALGLHLAGGSTSFFLAPLIGVGLAAAWGWRGAFLGLSVPFFLFGIVLYLLIGRQQVKRVKQTSRASSENENDSKDSNLTQLIAVITLTVVSRVLGGSVQAFIPLYMVDHFGVDEKTAGAFLAIIFSSGFWAGPLGGHISDRVGALRLLIAMALIHGPILYLLVLVPYGLGFASVLLLLGIHMFMRTPSAESLIISSVPKRIRSTVLGFYFFASTELSGLLTPLLGIIIDRIGFRLTFTLASASILVVTLLICGFLVLLKKRQKQAALSRN
jgi:FSR family fosmidomycin resistance protein-like MFS transporter